jgi:hypothetical protein
MAENIKSRLMSFSLQIKRKTDKIFTTGKMIEAILIRPCVRYIPVTILSCWLLSQLYRGSVQHLSEPLFGLRPVGKRGVGGDFMENGFIQKIPINPPLPKGKMQRQARLRRASWNDSKCGLTYELLSNYANIVNVSGKTTGMRWNRNFVS